MGPFLAMVSGEAQQIVMEYMEYGSLEQFLHSHRHLTQTAHYQAEGGGGGGFEGGVGLGPVSLLCMLGDVADAMNYLHLNNYVHRVSHCMLFIRVLSFSSPINV